MGRDTLWTNKDGLRVGFGTHSEDNDVGAVYSGANGEVTYVEELLLVDLNDTASDTSTPQQHVIPRGSIILRGNVQAIVGASASTTTLDIGTWSRGLTTEIEDDANGLISAIDDALLANVGDTLVMDGVLVADAADSNLAVAGATSDSDVIVIGSWNTNVHTAGKLRITVTYRPPTGSMGRVLAV